MSQNPIQFAVVREDPDIEISIIERYHCENILLIGSGGCTALTLQQKFPNLEMTLVEPNPAQISLIQSKKNALQLSSQERKSVFNIGRDNVKGLNACGNFESLFRGLRDFIYEFVCDKEFFLQLFSGSGQENLPKIFANNFWPVAFDMYFCDQILNTMFGSNATQHAPKGSYPAYFRGVLEKGLTAKNAMTNYFLHHIFLGYYLDREDSLPAYLAGDHTPTKHFEFKACKIDAIDDFSCYDLIVLSNIFDWMPEVEVSAIARRLCQELRSNALILYRQLNHSKNFQKLFIPKFQFITEAENQFLVKDRSLFYSKFNLGLHI